MKPHHTPDVFGHEPKRKELPLLELDNTGFKAVEEIIREHLPGATRRPVATTISGESKHVDNSATNSPASPSTDGS